MAVRSVEKVKIRWKRICHFFADLYGHPQITILPFVHWYAQIKIVIVHIYLYLFSLFSAFVVFYNHNFQLSTLFYNTQWGAMRKEEQKKNHVIQVHSFKHLWCFVLAPKCLTWTETVDVLCWIFGLGKFYRNNFYRN